MEEPDPSESELLRLAHAVESEIGFWQWDIKNNIVTWSPHVYEIFEKEQNEFDGTIESYRKLLHPDDLPMIDETINQAVKFRKNYTFRHRLLFPNKSVRWLEAVGSVVAENDDAVKIVGFVRDITKDEESRQFKERLIEEQNRRLIATTSDLKKKINQLEEFTYIVSHNLRGPVNNILAMFDLRDITMSTLEKEETIKLIKTNTKHIQTTLNDLNRILVIQQNKSIERQSLVLETVLHKVMELHKLKIIETQAEVVHDFREVPYLKYPAIYLESILMNLLSNAIKYSRPSVSPKIEFKTYIKEHHIFLECQDNGLGIDLQRHGNQIFKLHKTFHNHREAQGMGLFLIKNQIEALNGEITVQSQVNEGSKFIIRF